MNTTFKITFLFFILNNFSFSQDYLKEVSKTFENGQPMFIDYLDIEDLKKVKTDMFNENGDKIFSISFNKENGLPDGEFFDLINKGYFKNGVLYCGNCMLVESNSPSVFTYNYDKQNTYITKGSVVNGRFKGKVEKFGYFEETFRKVDWESTRRYVKAGAGVGFRDVKTYRTGVYNRTSTEYLYYNDNGQIEGSYTKYRGDLQINLDINDGIIETYVLKDGKGIVVDSLSNQNKIWKINYKFIKNNGLLVFERFNDIRGPRELKDYDSSNSGFDIYDYDYIICENERDKRLSNYHLDRYQRTISKQIDLNAIVPVGGNISVEYEERNLYDSERAMNSGGKPSILDENGIYSLYNEKLIESYLKSLYIDINDFGSGDKQRSDVSYSQRENNLFTLLYNYLINDFNDFLNKKFNDQDPDDNEGWYGSLYIFKKIIESENEENIYKKYLNPPFNKKQPFSEYKKHSSFRSFFSKVITLSGYLSSISEIISSDDIETQKLYVWNYKLNKYDLVNFDNLIEIAKNKESEISEINDVETPNNVNQKSNNDNFNEDDLSLWLTSDKKENKEKYNFVLKLTAKSVSGLIKIHQLSYNGDLDPSNAYYRYFFDNQNSFDEYTSYLSSVKTHEILKKDTKNLTLLFRPVKQ
jgi:hypothetical protein